MGRHWIRSGMDENQMENGNINMINGMGMEMIAIGMTMSEMDRALTAGSAAIALPNGTPMYQHYNSTPNTPLRKPLKSKRKVPKMSKQSNSRPSKLNLCTQSTTNLHNNTYMNMHRNIDMNIRNSNMQHIQHIADLNLLTKGRSGSGSRL